MTKKESQDDILHFLRILILKKNLFVLNLKVTIILYNIQ